MADEPGSTVTSRRVDRAGLAKDLLIGAAVAAVYFLGAELGLSLAFVNSSASAVWPPTGIAIGALVVLGVRFWPAVLVGAFLANLDNSHHLASSAVIALGNAMEGLAGALAIARWAGGRDAFQRPRDVFHFIAWGGLAAPLISASIGTETLVYFGLAPASLAPSIWTTWYLGDAAGAIVLAPAIILVARLRDKGGLPKRNVETVAVFLLSLMSALVIWGPAGATSLVQGRPVTLLAVPFVLWAALRLGPLTTSLLIVAVDAIAVSGTLAGRGPFAVGPPNDSLLYLQAFLALLTMLTLPTAALAHQQAKAQAGLRRAAQTLEQTVAERTADLKESEVALRKNLMTTAQAELATGRGSWEWDLAKDKAQWSEGMYRLFGLDPATFSNSNEAFLAMVHPDDRQRMGAAIAEALAHPGPFLQDYRLTRPDGKTIHVRGEGSVVTDDQGRPTTLYGVVVDVTAKHAADEERKRLQDAMAASEARLRSIFTNSPVGIILTRMDGTIVDLNPAAERLWGRSRAEFFDAAFRSDRLYADPSERAKVVAALREKGGGAVELRMRRGDGVVRRMSFSVELIELDGEKVFLASGIDVTPARESEERFRLLFEANPLGVVIASADGSSFLDVNPAFERLVDYSKAELTAPGFPLANVSTEPERLARLLGSIRKKGGAEGLEIDLKRKGGQVRTAIASVRALDLAGRPSILAAMQDVTDQKAAEDEVRRAQERFARIFEASPIAIGLTREDGRIVDVNPAFAQLTGYEREEVLAPGFSARRLYDDPHERDLFMAALRSSGIVREAEFDLRRKDGSVRSAVVTLEFMDLGGSTTVLSILQDVTERKRMQQEREARIANEAEIDRLRRTDQFRTEFINSTAHELSTPMTPLMLSLGTLRAAIKEENAQRLMDKMQRSVERLRHVIADMVAAADLQARAITLDRQRLNLTRQLKAALAGHLEAAQRANISLVEPEDTRLSVLADEHRVQLVLGHLLGNALKFTPSGGSVRLSSRRDGDFARVEVTDTGAGLTARQIRELWKPYSQVHDKSQRTDSGAGLGLYVVKGTVDLHKGEVGCSSPGPGLGSTFWFTLPLAPGS